MRRKRETKKKMMLVQVVKAGALSCLVYTQLLIRESTMLS